MTPRPPVKFVAPATPRVDAKLPAPVIFKALPPNILPLTPTPPVTINAPDDGLVEAVDPVILAVVVLTAEPAENVVVVRVLDPGLKNKPASEETATPLPPFTGENNI